jgi:beta-lactamase superfamily II metal-dependent hydrolase
MDSAAIRGSKNFRAWGGTMDIFTLYVGQGALTAARAGDEAIIIDAHMVECDEVAEEQIQLSLNSYLAKKTVRGLILTGFDQDHACPAGVEHILAKYELDWIMYPKYYKDTDAASEVFSIIERCEKRRANTLHPLLRKSVRVDRIESRHLTGLAKHFSFELFSPHMDDMDSSNNSSIVLKLTGLDHSSFSYLITGDTETDRWDGINRYFGKSLASRVLAAPHHGSTNGVNARTLLHVDPHTVLISAGVGNSYGHPDPAAVKAFRAVARRVYSTNASPEGVCFLTRRVDDDYQTLSVRHLEPVGAPAS